MLLPVFQTHKAEHLPECLTQILRVDCLLVACVLSLNPFFFAEAGVLYVHVHAAKNVRAPTPSLDNVFCCVTWGEKTILRTHTLPGSCDPVWEKGIELIVPSCNGIRLEFNVLSESQGMATNSLIGSTFLSLNEVRAYILRQFVLFVHFLSLFCFLIL